MSSKKFVVGFVFLLLSFYSGVANLSHKTYKESSAFYRKAKIDRHCKVIQNELRINNTVKIFEGIRYGDFWQDYWEPSWTCPLEERIMKVVDPDRFSSGDGGKWVCDVPKLPNNCLVYSFGSNGEYSFEFGLQERLNTTCEIHTFDPFDIGRNETIAPCEKYKVQRHLWGLGPKTLLTDPLPKWNNKQMEMKTLVDVVKLLGHSGRAIDILKVDIDGTELGLLDTDIFWEQVNEAGIIIHQLLIELHFQGISSTSYRFRENTGQWVPKTPGPYVDRILRMLTKQGFAIFHKEVNLIGKPPNDACEFAMVRLNIDCGSNNGTASSGSSGSVAGKVVVL